ncbi:unnamed protein product [Polarella glacialis]|uniref:Uncharacterized protein n=1 Tax=Polarella glacialis TaxID=89957 RepID=A0A813G3G7_POLGL|nr:unnamed protein product [Polarella glacialis]CAE8734788.1 unnamed protein product [Polarella glacialis]
MLDPNIFVKLVWSTMGSVAGLLKDEEATGTTDVACCSSVAAVWEATLWKQSEFFGIWRERRLRLVRTVTGWELSSWDSERLTGTWELERSLPYIDCTRNKHGFLAAMELNGIVLAADTELGAAAMEELAVILNGRLMRQASPRCSPNSSFRAACSETPYSWKYEKRSQMRKESSV